MGPLKINCEPYEVEHNNQEKVNLERHKTNVHVARFHLLCKQSKRRGWRCKMLCVLLSKAYFHLEVGIERIAIYIYNIFWYHGHPSGSLETIWKWSVSKKDISYKIPGWKIFSIKIETYTIFNVSLLAPLSKALAWLSDIWYAVNCKVNSTTKDPTAWLAWWLTCGITALHVLYIICKKKTHHV
jgi:hypothetical protein